VTALTSRLRRPLLTTSYDRDLRLFKSRASKVALAALFVVWVLMPNQASDFWLNVLNRAGVFAIGAIGLNLLTGYTGQVSLGHAFFMAVGAYTWAEFGARHSLPLLIWLPLAAVIGGVVGAVVGPFALRLRGNYLAIVSLGLVFIGTHIWNNWESLTGGASGVSGDRAARIGPLNFAKLSIGGQHFTLEQGYFWLIWALVALAALLAKNIVRSRPGRAMQAVRDRDVAAEVVGVSLFRYKVGAFVISSAIATFAGVLYGLYLGYLTPDQTSLGLVLSIQFLAVIVVGGIGTIYGSILGAILIGALPKIIEQFVPDNWNLPVLGWPIVTNDSGATGFTKGALSTIIYALLIIVFLVFEPRGLAGIWRRIQAYFKTWPFSY
jgi:branched-chain amino acid transport system permease protein